MTAGDSLNVLVMIADEMRRDAPGCLGGDARTMPTLDALAARGTAFERAYTPSPMCVPARGSIATGRHVHETGVWDSATGYQGEPRSWMHALAAAGTPVTSFGKLHFRDEASDTGFVRQVRPMHVVGRDGWPQALLRGEGTFDHTAEFARDVGYGDSAYMAYDRATTDAACAFLADRGRDGAPWGAFVSWVCPHYPLIAPEAYRGLFAPGDIPPPVAAARRSRPAHPELARIADFFDYDAHFTPERAAEARAAYLALCRFVDDQVAAVMEALEASGLADGTLAVFASDHGEMLGDLRFWTKQVMYEGSVGVPLIAAGPGVPAGRCRTPVSLIDLAPTALAAAGAAADPDLPGRDLRAIAKAPDDPGRTAFSEYHDGGSSTGAFMVRWDGWKYVHYVGMAPQLFDLDADPRELADRAADPVAADARREGEARLRAICDPDAVNAAAFADQARRLEAAGGREAVGRMASFGHTPAPP